ncbi:MAG: hypothetical protein ACI4IR_09550 [Eubacterium sp.]
MEYNFIPKVLLVTMLYLDLFYIKYKWDYDNVFVYKKNPNKYFQPILYKFYGLKKIKIEIGLLILETYSHSITIIVIVETIIAYCFNLSILKPFVLFSFWLISGIFVMLYLSINDIKNKK